MAILLFPLFSVNINTKIVRIFFYLETTRHEEHFFNSPSDTYIELDCPETGSMHVYMPSTEFFAPEKSIRFPFERKAIGNVTIPLSLLHCRLLTEDNGPLQSRK